MKKRICPKCNIKYTNQPAISRIDNKTEICPNCGLTEAIESIIKYNRSRKQKKYPVKLVS